ncbi:MAG: NAD(P)H-hydrate dehydratase [Betaproteobacteria bacterium]
MQGVGLYRVEELRAVEARATEGLPPRTLMQRAGRAAAESVVRRYPDARRVLILCGPGNNGGDGYELATRLKQAQRDALCVALSPPIADEARGARALWDAAGGITAPHLPTGQPFDLVVDAMFGIGLTRPLRAAYLDAARWMNDQAAPVLALDVPSGLDADTGAWVGGVQGVLADATIAFIAAKPGLLTHAGCDASGAVEVADLTIELPAPTGWRNGPEHFRTVNAPRRRDTHKGSFGDVAVVGGGVGMLGAPLLAARAALRLGAGRVYVECIGAPALRLDPLQPELMFCPSASLPRADAWVVGCGLGSDAAAQAALRAVLVRADTVVLDADALNLLAAGAVLLTRSDQTRVLTPHPLEAARLLGADAAGVQADRIAAARALAHRHSAFVVLKGAGSVVAAPDGRYWINPTGSPALATPGSGDVLAGMIGALLAQGFYPLHALLAAVWLHGAAADRFGGDVGLAAGDLPSLAAAALAELRRASSVAR